MSSHSIPTGTIKKMLKPELRYLRSTVNEWAHAYKNDGANEIYMKISEGTTHVTTDICFTVILNMKISKQQLDELKPIPLLLCWVAWPPIVEQISKANKKLPLVID